MTDLERHRADGVVLSKVEFFEAVSRYTGIPFGECLKFLKEKCGIEIIVRKVL